MLTHQFLWLGSTVEVTTPGEVGGSLEALMVATPINGHGNRLIGGTETNISQCGGFKFMKYNVTSC